MIYFKALMYNTYNKGILCLHLNTPHSTCWVGVGGIRVNLNLVTFTWCFVCDRWNLILFNPVVCGKALSSILSLFTTPSYPWLEMSTAQTYYGI